MQSIITQCQDLDEEYRQLVYVVNNMLDNLSIVSLEFVNSKLEFLDKYSNTLKSSQIDARIHRNSQMKNLIEYIKMHTKSQVKSLAQSPPAKMAHHRPKYSFNEKAFSSILYSSINQVTQQKTQYNDELDQSEQKPTLKQKNLNILQNLIGKQKFEQKRGNDDMFNLLQKCMHLISQKQEFYEEYENLQKEYKDIVKSNQSLQFKVNLDQKSSKLKENLNQLMGSHQQFKSYLNSVI
ncbi:unnamed protein product (macronuclear) [Paramecium tetraurelia]|uniref:Uncharacterized protein n=1 Tax=Paramecium tetraurelia TaxID=5888 RepID=A0E9E4_PARTE|nr:uncharacterized protein GSPATT00024642001 [Paramecium tetraurelia]CAK91911.1 unnamed protein product [Paramecium tetraurelia]|eukprot:XP_001459308.1 hypothetical protein (macronuclear) [Paramecium tetraurelia strain d4-2]